MGSRIAIIDLGTNTFHLLIVDLEKNEYSIVYREREAVKLGMHGINNDTITDDALARALSTLSGFKKTIDLMQVGETYAYGTSALRNAQNKNEVVTKIKNETGIEIAIISGDEEARLIYLGVRAAIPLGKSPALVMDIGGGSVEFIISTESDILWKESFEIGAQRLLEEYQHHDPILPEEIDKLQKHLDLKLQNLFDALRIHKPKTLVGSSGTFDTLSDIYCIKRNIFKERDAVETPLTFEGFREIYEELLIKNRNDRMQIPGMIEMRVDMIVVACCLIDFIIARFPFDKIRVSNYALKEGILAEIVASHHTK